MEWVRGLPRAVEVDRERAGELAVRSEASEDGLGVRDGELLAGAVAGGAGDGTSRLRSDAQRAAGVDARDGSATRADGVHVDDGRPRGEVADDHVRARRDRAVAECDVGGGAAHVEGDDAVVARRAGDLEGPVDARGRAGEQGGDREARGTVDTRRAAVALDDVEGGYPSRRHALAEGVEVLRHHGADVRVERRGGCALDLAVLGGDLRGEREEERRAGRAERLLERWIEVGVEKRDGDGLCPRSFRAGEDLARLLDAP